VKIAFVDTETTAAESWNGEVWEAAVVIDDGGRVVDEWEGRFAPAHLFTASPGALAIGGFYERGPVGSDEPTKDTQQAAALQLAQKLSGAAFASCNVSFDTAHLTNLLHAHGQAPCWHYSPIDVKSVAVGARPTLLWMPKDDPDALFSMPSTNQIVQAFQIDLYAIGARVSGNRRHSALFDAHLARSIFWKALYESGSSQSPPEEIYGW
jgi:hypothetical protein